MAPDEFTVSYHSALSELYLFRQDFGSENDERSTPFRAQKCHYRLQCRPSGVQRLARLSSEFLYP